MRSSGQWSDPVGARQLRTRAFRRRTPTNERSHELVHALTILNMAGSMRVHTISNSHRACPMQVSTLFCPPPDRIAPNPARSVPRPRTAHTPSHLAPPMLTPQGAEPTKCSDLAENGRTIAGVRCAEWTFAAAELHGAAAKYSAVTPTNSAPLPAPCILRAASIFCVIWKSRHVFYGLHLCILETVREAIE